MNILPMLMALCVALGYARPPVDVLGAIARHAPDEDAARLMVVWAAHESGFSNNPAPMSADSLAGKSRCFLQVQAIGPLTLDECAARWVNALQAGEKMCGSRAGALKMISSGYCDRAGSLVARRMLEAILL